MYVSHCPNGLETLSGIRIIIRSFKQHLTFERFIMAFRPAAKSLDLQIVMHPAALITLDLNFCCEIMWDSNNDLDRYDGKFTFDLPRLLHHNYNCRDCDGCLGALGPIIHSDTFMDLNVDRRAPIEVSAQLATCVAVLQCNVRDCRRIYCIFVSKRDAQMEPQILNGAHELPANIVVKLPRPSFDENYADIAFRFNRSYRECRFKR